MKLADLLSKEAVFPHVVARDKKQALKHMAAMAATICRIPEKEIFSELMEREDQGTTCMGRGVCIPHGLLPGLDKPYAFFARFDSPVEFEGADGKPVDLMFLLLSPQDINTDYVVSLALLSRLLRNKDLREKLRVADSAETLFSLLQTADNDNDLT